MSIRLAGLVVGFFALLTMAPPALAERILEWEITLKKPNEGRFIVGGKISDNGNEDPDAVWRTLAKVELRPTFGVKIKADPGKPLQATIPGPIYIWARLGGSIDLPSIKLIREKEDSQIWRIPEADVEKWLKTRKKP